ncbi:uncharacterized protein TNCV_2906591 [Trichonephila clavipes]|nr:uncharacterized protein TNCV_2906591 [Trichonephila clavipes]
MVKTGFLDHSRNFGTFDEFLRRVVHYLAHAPCFKNISTDSKKCAPKYRKMAILSQELKEEDKDAALKSVCCALKDFTVCKHEHALRDCGPGATQFLQRHMERMSGSLINEHCVLYTYGAGSCSSHFRNSKIPSAGHWSVVFFLIICLCYSWVTRMKVAFLLELGKLEEYWAPSADPARCTLKAWAIILQDSTSLMCLWRNDVVTANLWGSRTSRTSRRVNTHIFGPLQKAFKGRRIADDNDIQTAVENWFHNQNWNLFTSIMS